MNTRDLKNEEPTPAMEEKKDLKTFLKENSSNLVNITVPRTIALNNKQVTEVIDNFKNKQKLTKNQALVVIALLFQAGGTNKSCDGNLEVEAFGQKVKLANLRKSLTECKLKGSERKLARALADDIHLISKELSLPGNLAMKIQNMDPNNIIPIEIQVWLSDFQAKNPNCPQEARSLINTAFQQRKVNNKKSR